MLFAVGENEFPEFKGAQISNIQQDVAMESNKTSLRYQIPPSFEEVKYYEALKLNK